MSTTSENFKMVLPEEADYYDVTIFNDNFNIIDELLNRVSEQESGYIKLGRNLIVQWGKEQVSYTGGKHKVYFPLQFGTVLNVQLTNIYSDGGSGDVLDAGKYTRLYGEPTSEYFGVLNTINNESKIYWMAIGLA